MTFTFLCLGSVLSMKRSSGMKRDSIIYYFSRYLKSHKSLLLKRIFIWPRYYHGRGVLTKNLQGAFQTLTLNHCAIWDTFTRDGNTGTLGSVFQSCVCACSVQGVSLWVYMVIWSVFTARKWSWWKVMFFTSVCHSAHRWVVPSHNVSLLKPAPRDCTP